MAGLFLGRPSGARALGKKQSGENVNPNVAYGILRASRRLVQAAPARPSGGPFHQGDFQMNESANPDAQDANARSRSSAPRRDSQPRGRRKDTEAPRSRGPRRTSDFRSVSDLQSLLSTFGDEPRVSLHVNGAAFPGAVLAVDFGPKSFRMNAEQMQDLVGRMRRASREIIGKDVNIRVSNDAHNGIWWASVG